jgi:predicted DCC family thiol-disulfide oxidoreductase YuxK
VQFTLRHERQHGLRFAALDSEAGRRVRARHIETADVDSMIWVEDPDSSDEHVLIRSDAGLRIARYMGGVWHLARLGRVVPRPLRDAAYDFIARHRHRIVAERAQCYLPPISVRRRFLDQPTQ